jgi:membrane-associated phospholipid phosphatase
MRAGVVQPLTRMSFGQEASDVPPRMSCPAWWARVFLGLILCALPQTISAQTVLCAQEGFPDVVAIPRAPFSSVSISVFPQPTLMQAESGSQGQAQSTTSSVPNSREVSWRRLPANVLHDQEHLWLFPLQLAHGPHWLPTAALLGITAGLLASDAHDAPYFRQTSNFAGFNRAFSGTATALEIALVPSAMYGIGLMRKDSYAQQTALLSGEAVLDSGVLAIVVKDVSRRLRPSDIAPHGDFSDTFFRTHPTLVGAGSAFPSGHAELAFAVATIMARRYGARHSWVPWVAYGTAGVIGFSRITLQAHFPSDVFLGAALGYSVARFDVLNR